MERNRNFRREVQTRTITRFFKALFAYEQGRWFRNARVSGYETHIGADKWAEQNQERLEVLVWARRRANNRCSCSCSLCKWGLNDREVDRRRIKKDDEEDVLDYLQGE